MFIDVLDWAHCRFNNDVQLIAGGSTWQVVSALNVPVIVKRVLEKIDVEEVDAIVILGGLRDFDFFEKAFYERFLNLLRQFDYNGKIIASVCVAALALGKSGVLENRSSTICHLDSGKTS